MSIRLRVSAAVVMAALVVMSVVGLIAQRNQAALIDMARRRELESYSRNLASLLELAANQAVAEAELVANTESVRKLFRSGVDAMLQPSPPSDQKAAASTYRRLLVEELGQTYEVQHTQFGVVQAQFHRHPAISFLRFHDPDKWNDDLSGIRPTVLECNSKGRAVKGIEVGRGGFGIRGVVPVTDKTGPIGSFEIGLGLAPILEEFKKTTGASVSVFADIAVQGRVTWDERTERGKTIGIYRHIHSTDTALMEHLVTEADLAVSSMRISKASSDQTEYGVSYFPLRDFGGKRVGIAVIAKDFSEFTAQSTSAARSSLVLVAAGLGLLVLVVLMVVNALVVVPLRKISAAADEVSTGKVHTTITMTARRDEIGTIAKSFDRMRISLEKAMDSLERMGG